MLRRARARHGPVFTLQLDGPLVFVADPGAVGPLLAADGAGAARREVLPLASPHSLFGADAGEHRALRAAMEPAFAIAGREDEIAALAAEHVARWPRGRPFRLLTAMRELASDVFVRVVLRVEDPARRAALVAAIRRMLRTPGNPPLPIPESTIVDRVFRWRIAPLVRLLEQELAVGNDLLAAMPGTPREAVDRLLVVLAAGQEPPSIALANVVYELARRPELQERARHDPGLLDAVVEETLRLRPSASAALRTPAAPLEVAGRTLPAGTPVALPSPLLHRDPAAFPEPDAFRPGRAIPGGAPYFPFGGGARRCIGEPLARAELRIVVPAVLAHLRVRAVWPRPERMVVRGTVLVPHRGAVVRATPLAAPQRPE
ncbi:MAG TPA: cytochrome P450 [Solirubrobacter sp.]|nr:cytochrome P450 [Solirubrobacter sp.]